MLFGKGRELASTWVWVHSEDLLNASEGELACRKAIRSILLGRSTIEEIEAIVNYMASDFWSEEGETDEEEANSSGSHVPSDSGKKSPHLIDIEEHSRLHHRGSTSNIAQSLVSALRQLASDGSYMGNSSNLARSEQNAIDDGDLGGTGDSEAATHTDTLNRVYDLVLEILDELSEADHELPPAQEMFLLECSLLVLLHLRRIGETDSTYVYPVSKSIFSLVTNPIIEEKLNQGSELRSLCIFFVLLYCIDSTGSPTETMKECLVRLQFTENQLEEMCTKWSNYPNCPDLTALQTSAGRICSVVSRREVLKPLMVLYEIALHEGKAFPEVKERAKIDVNDLWGTASKNGLDIWIKRLRARLLRSGKAVCLVNLNEKGKGSIVCPGCNTSLNYRTISNLRKQVPSPEICERCQAILLEMVE